jgi:hypothetical protein
MKGLSQMTAPANPQLDKSAFSVSNSFEHSAEKTYWLTRTPHERLRHIETLRRINYGNRATARLQRVLEITQRASG